MIRELLIITCSTILAQAGVIDKVYSPATSYSRISLSPVFTKSVEAPSIQKSQTIYEEHEISPIYDLGSNLQEYNNGNGAQQRTFSKSLNSGSSQINTIYQSESNNNQGSVSPLVYTTSAALPKPVSLPSYSIGNSRILYNSKVTPGLSAYASASGPTEVKTQVIAVDQAENISVPDNSAASQATISGIGASYSW